MDIVQHMRQTGEIPQDLGLTVLIPIPKGITDTRGIGLLETIWKVVEALIHTHLRASLQFHDVLHGFQDGRWTGTSTMYLKLAQEIPSIDHNPLLLVFLELQNNYETMERDPLIQILEGYGAGYCM